MTFQQELASWNPFGSASTHPVAAAPSSGTPAPSAGELTFPSTDRKPTVVTFLRHCGCPFAEKTFRRMRALAEQHPDAHFVAVSHSDAAATEAWLQNIGGPGQVRVIVDDERRIYAAWGLGTSSFWHVLSPGGLMNVYNLGKQEGINVRPTASGTRWQTAGSFAVDGAGTVRWARIPARADEDPDLDAALAAATQ